MSNHVGGTAGELNLPEFAFRIGEHCADDKNEAHDDPVAPAEPEADKDNSRGSVEAQQEKHGRVEHRKDDPGDAVYQAANYDGLPVMAIVMADKKVSQCNNQVRPGPSNTTEEAENESHAYGPDHTSQRGIKDKLDIKGEFHVHVPIETCFRLAGETLLIDLGGF